jgi:murein DD-endopeptidase
MAIRRSVRQGAAAAVLVVLLGCLTAGCAHTPVRRVEGYTPAAGEKAAMTATGMIGRPYKFKGDSPEGFDCSGLVQYSYLTAGVVAPHGTRELMGVTRSVGSLRDARPGDLLFFSQEGKKYSHVGIYVGSDQFVHAPSTGGRVRRDGMSDPYWKKHYLDTRRFP